MFPKVTIVRCPQLYGENLRKNFVFDLIFDNALDFTHKDSQFQWYNLKNIWKDIEDTSKIIDLRYHIASYLDPRMKELWYLLPLEQEKKKT